MLTSLAQTVRSLTKRPGFFAAAVLLIAVGIAASTTAFTLIQTLFYKPRAGVVDANTIYNVHRMPAAAGPSISSWSYPDFVKLAAVSKQFSAISAFTGLEAGFTANGHSVSVMTQVVSANFFGLLGARAQHGRFFLPEEDREIGRHPVVVISDKLWREQLGADPAAVGHTVRVNGEVLTVIGVAEPGFHGTFIGFDFDVWVPMGMARVIGQEEDLASDTSAWLELIGRLAPGSTDISAQAELDRIAQRLTEGRSAVFRNFHVKLTPSRPIDDDLRGSALGFVGALSAIAGLVLLTACLNVSSLLLTRAEERRRESAVRLALGCSQRRLIGEWLRESFVIFATGGLAGFLLAKLIAAFSLLREPSAGLGLMFDFQPDGMAFAFSFAVALLAGLLTGLLPARSAARADLVNDLKAGDSRGSTGSARLRNVVVIAQLAFSIVPLVATGLFVRTLDQTLRINPGFEARNLLVTELNLTQLGDKGPANNARVARRLLERAQALPGVSSASLASRAPLGLGGMQAGVAVDQLATPQPEEGFTLRITFADAGYFDTLRLPLLAGRGFQPSDHQAGAVPVAVINQSTARLLFGDRDPINREIRRDKTVLRVVGVTRDAKYSKLWEEPVAQLYLPFGPNMRPRMRLLVRTEDNAAALAPTLQRALQETEPDLPLAPPTQAADVISLTLLPQKLGAQIASVLGGVCLLLAGIGLYGVLSLGAVRQMREFGIRLALGARPAQVAGLVGRRVALLVGLGLVAGTGLAWGVSTLLRSFLHGVGELDPVTYGTVALALTLVALLAAWLPARRATRVDPMVALRAE